MAATLRMCCALRSTFGGAVPLRTTVAAAQISHFTNQASAFIVLQRSSLLPAHPSTAWQQTRHGSFFNKLTAAELWKGVLAETGAGARKGRGKRTKRKLKTDLNRGQVMGEGQAGFLWPGLNAPVLKNGVIQSLSQRSQSEQKIVQAEMALKREEYDRKRKAKVKKERGWTGRSWGGLSLGPPDPGPNGETYENFDSRIIEMKYVSTMRAKEGRKRTVSCLVAVGNGQGAAGFAVGKGPDRISAQRKAKNRATHYLYYIDLYQNHTIYHDITSKYKKTTLRIKKQTRGEGLHCHRAIITICKLIGIKDMYCKVDGSTNYLNITRALFSGLATQQSHQSLADSKQLNVVEFRSETGPLPILVAKPKDGARADPEREDEIPNSRLNWDDVQLAQETNRSIWAGVKRSIS